MLLEDAGDEVAASPQLDAAPRRGVMQKALAMWILLATRVLMS